MRTLSIKRKDKGDGCVPLRLGPPIDGAKPFEVYGFVGSIGSLVALAVYIIWAYVPESWLHALGITYYPSRYWAVAIPSYIMVSLLFVCSLYASLNFISTPLPQSFYTLFDEHTRPHIDQPLSSCLHEEERPIIHSYSDIPITEVNALLLGTPSLKGMHGSYFGEFSG